MGLLEALNGAAAAPPSFRELDRRAHGLDGYLWAPCVVRVGAWQPPRCRGVDVAAGRPRPGGNETAFLRGKWNRCRAAGHSGLFWLIAHGFGRLVSADTGGGAAVEGFVLAPASGAVSRSSPQNRTTCEKTAADTCTATGEAGESPMIYPAAGAEGLIRGTCRAVRVERRHVSHEITSWLYELPFQGST